MRSIEDAQVIEQVSTSAATAVGSTCAVQTVINFFASASLSQIWGILNSQQLVVHLPMLKQGRFPANASSVLAMFIKFATFDLIPTEKIDDLIYNWPDSDAFNLGFETSGVESNYFLSNIGFALYVIFAYVLLIVINIGPYLLRNKSTCCKKSHEKLSSYLYWDALIRLYMEVFFDLTLLAILNVHTAEWDSSYSSVKASNIVSVFTLVAIFGIMAFFIVRYILLPSETKAEDFGSKFPPLLDGTSISEKESNWHLILVPISFFLRRIIFVLVLILGDDFLWI